MDDNTGFNQRLPARCHVNTCLCMQGVMEEMEGGGSSAGGGKGVVSCFISFF